MQNHNEFITKNQQNVETFKFFEKTRNRKVSNTSPKSNKYIKRPLIVLPVQRTRRLKSEIFVETSPKNLPDGEYDISKEDFNTSDISLESLSGGRNVVKSNGNEESVEKDESVERDDSVVKDESDGKKKVKQPMRRTTRLKSTVFVECFPQDLSDDEFNKSKEDLNTTQLKRKRKLKKTDTSSLNGSLLNDSNTVRDELKDKQTSRLKLKHSDESATKNSAVDELEEDFNTSELSRKVVKEKRKSKKAKSPDKSVISDSKAEENEIEIEKREEQPKIVLPQQRRTRLKLKLFESNSPEGADELEVNKEDINKNELRPNPQKEKNKSKCVKTPIKNAISATNAEENELETEKREEQPKIALKMQRRTRLKSKHFESSPSSNSPESNEMELNKKDVNMIELSRTPQKEENKSKIAQTPIKNAISATNAEENELDIEKSEEQPKNVLALQRRTRLKSKLFESSPPSNSPEDNEMELNKKDVNTLESSRTPQKEKNKSKIAQTPIKNAISATNAEENELEIEKKEEQPMRRRTRLKSKLFESSPPSNSPEAADELEVNKEDVNTIELSRTPQKEKNKSKIAMTPIKNAISATNMEKNEEEGQPKIVQPMRRSKTSKSKHILESSQEDLNTSDLRMMEPAKKKRKLTKKLKTPIKENLLFSDSNVEENELNSTINNIVNSLTDDTPLERPKEVKGKNTKHDNSFENLTDNMLQSIDTNAIVEMLQNTSLDSQKSQEEDEFKTNKSSKKRKRKLTECVGSDDHQQQLDLTQNCNEINANLDTITKSPKKNRKNLEADNVEELNGHQRIVEEDILSNNDQQQLDITNNDGNLSTNLDTESKPNKKHVRKSLAKKFEEFNVEQQQREQQKSIEIDNSDTEILLPDHQTPQPILSTKIPQKRGRKPKESSKEEKITNNSDTENILQDKETTELPPANEMIINSKNSDKTSETPKKRGRKPKSLNSTLKEKSNNDTNTNGILKYLTNKDKPVEEVNQKTTTPQKATLKHTDNTESNIEDDPTANESDQSYVPVKEKRKSLRRKSINNTSANDDTSDNNSSNTNSVQPRKRGRPKSKIQKHVKVNVPKENAKKKVTKISKLTKEQIKQSSSRRIPKQRLEKVLEIIADKDHEIWDERNISCNASIFTYWQPRTHSISEQNLKLKYARQFLLRRDWISLSKILSLSNSESSIYYPLLAKYAALLLAHTDSEQFNRCMQFLARVNDGSAILKKCTRIQTDLD